LSDRLTTFITNLVSGILFLSKTKKMTTKDPTSGRSLDISLSDVEDQKKVTTASKITNQQILMVTTSLFGGFVIAEIIGALVR
jgi:hypothetical protein